TRTVAGDVLPTAHLQRGRVAHDVDRVTATARGLAANGAVAAHIRLRRIRIEREFHSAAAARAGDLHRCLLVVGAADDSAATRHRASAGDWRAPAVAPDQAGTGVPDVARWSLCSSLAR